MGGCQGSRYSPSLCKAVMLSLKQKSRMTISCDVMSTSLFLQACILASDPYADELSFSPGKR